MKIFFRIFMIILRYVLYKLQLIDYIIEIEMFYNNYMKTYLDCYVPKSKNDYLNNFQEMKPQFGRFPDAAPQPIIPNPEECLIRKPEILDPVPYPIPNPIPDPIPDPNITTPVRSTGYINLYSNEYKIHIVFFVFLGGCFCLNVFAGVQDWLFWNEYYHEYPPRPRVRNRGKDIWDPFSDIIAKKFPPRYE